LQYSEEIHMADEITPVVYYVGTIPNKVGEGARLLNALKEAGINLTGFFGYPRARAAEIILVVDEKAPALGPIAKKAGVTLGKKQKAFLLSGDDRPGAVAEAMAKLAAAGINVASVHGVSGGACCYGAVITVDAAAVRKAAKVLAPPPASAPSA
jgi:hypothetical protein